MLERKTRFGYHGRTSALTARQQVEASIATSKALAEKERAEAATARKIYLVRFDQITPGDINAILEIYTGVTGKPSHPIDEQGFSSFRKEFIRHGFADYSIPTGEILELKRNPVSGTGPILEAKRKPGPNGEFFVRFTIGGAHTNSKYGRNETADKLRDQIDGYFLLQKRAVLLGNTY